MDTFLHAIAGYLFLTLVVRILTRRPGGQMTMFEFVLVFLIGGVAILATVGTDRSVTNCCCAILVIGLCHRGMSAAKNRLPALGRLVDGTPLVLLKNGEWQEEAMRGMKLDREDVSAAARTKGLRSVDQVQYAVLERNGGISIIEAEAEDEDEEEDQKDQDK